MARGRRPDGKILVFSQRSDKGAFGIWTLPLAGERKPSLSLAGDYGVSDGKLSPDGRWMAYNSMESGRSEVFVQSFPAKGAKFQVSTSGGQRPQWSRDGKEIFYISAGKLTAVDVKTGDHFEAGTPKPLFQTSIGLNQSFSMSPDGKRFLIPSAPEASANVPLTVVLHWTAALKK